MISAPKIKIPADNPICPRPGTSNDAPLLRSTSRSAVAKAMLVRKNVKGVNPVAVTNCVANWFRIGRPNSIPLFYN